MLQHQYGSPVGMLGKRAGIHPDLGPAQAGQRGSRVPWRPHSVKCMLPTLNSGVYAKGLARTLSLVWTSEAEGEEIRGEGTTLKLLPGAGGRKIRDRDLGPEVKLS